jgi:4-hydroxythreonine-4-phosphate dehydrogenase
MAQGRCCASPPIVALTMGDAAGVGPELLAKVLADPAGRRQCRPFVIGDPEVIRDACLLAGAGLEVRAIASLAEARFAASDIEVLCPPDLALGPFTVGVVDAALGRAAALCLAQAYELAAAGQVQAVVSGPMNKQAFHLAGYQYRDELEYVAHLTGSSDCYIVGVIAPNLMTVAVTEHVPFRTIADAVTRERVLAYIRRLHDVSARVGTAAPRLAVAALNVHGGEGGRFGREEIDAIGPAIEDARRAGIDATGPWPADTVFVRAREGEFDGVVCMYHDQANIARKLLATRRGATVFMGLPVVCTTTAHGTAFDKAGRGMADPGSLADALTCAARLARQAP